MASARLDSSRLTRQLHLHDELALPQSCSRTAARVVFGSPPASDFKAVSLAPSGVGKLVSPSLRAYYLFFRSVLFAPALWRHRRKIPAFPIFNSSLRWGNGFLEFVIVVWPPFKSRLLLFPWVSHLITSPVKPSPKPKSSCLCLITGLRTAWRRRFDGKFHASPAMSHSFDLFLMFGFFCYLSSPPPLPFALFHQLITGGGAKTVGWPEATSAYLETGVRDRAKEAGVLRAREAVSLREKKKLRRDISMSLSFQAASDLVGTI
ncbi:unnamed protein product [Arabidopsis lyrata]|nr:unnamed protein product [Arabidopsis lyrata]